ncbi:sodium:proton antiporter [candidate division WOR-3 bacterium]|nr:sodium:proton antiporter [candidate division WOR-3 bacterium]
MSEIVKTVSRLFSPLIFLFGIYITIHGHLTPGGGFAGGVILAGAVVLGILAYGGEKFGLTGKKNKASASESLGILLFWFVAILGLMFGGIFFLNFMGKGIPFHIFSAGIIPLCNIGIAVEVGGAISVIVLALILFEK